MEIYLIRHTKIIYPPNTCYGQSNLEVADSFEEEFNAIKNKLPDLSKFKFYSSPLKRCTKLASKLSSQNFSTDDRLKELNFGNWELKSWDQIDRATFDQWKQDYVNFKIPNGESLFQLSERSSKFFDYIKNQPDESIAIITHAGVIKTIVAHLLEMPLTKTVYINIDYGGITKITIDREITTINYINR